MTHKVMLSIATSASITVSRQQILQLRGKFRVFIRYFTIIQAIVMTPKSLLRHPQARSPIDDFTPGTRFKRVLPEAGEAAKNPDKVERLVFCTGTSSWFL